MKGGAISMEKKSDTIGNTITVPIDLPTNSNTKLDSTGNVIGEIRNDVDTVLDRCTLLENVIQKLMKKDRKRLGKWTHK